MHIADLLRQHAQSDPDLVAVWFPESGAGPTAWTPLTYGEVDAAADRVAAGLVAAGLRPGDRSLLMVKPSRDFYALTFGMFRAGVVPVFIDPGRGLKAVLACVGNIEPRALVGIPPVHAVSTVLRGPFHTLDVRITDGWRWWWGGSRLSDVAACTDPPPQISVDPDDDAVIVFTSGSTGPAKGVSLTHRCMMARVRSIQELFGLETGSTITETLLVYTILEMCMGLTVVIPKMDIARPATVDPAEVVAAVQRFSPRYASASPVVWQRLVRHCQDRGLRLDSLELLITTAAPIPVDLHRRLGDVLPATTELFTPYGATEAMPISRIGTAEILETTAARTEKGEGTCVGRLTPYTELHIIALSDEAIPTLDDATILPAGALGEILVRGDGVSRAYRNAPEGNVGAKVSDGDTTWHRMGDLGVLDEDGRLWFCGRVSHCLHTADGPVPCVPVEGVFNRHPKVYRTALVGLGDRGQQRPMLCVELEEGETWSAQLDAELRTLAGDTRWAGVVIQFLPHPGFPTDARHNSKIRREDLRDWAATRVKIPRDDPAS